LFVFGLIFALPRIVPVLMYVCLFTYDAMQCIPFAQSTISFP
jgi:hypothetical protein